MTSVIQEKTPRSTPSFDRKDSELGVKHEPVADEVVAEVTGAQFEDPNLDRDHLGELEEDSPYPEVRSAVANTDDPDMPCNTLRYLCS
ncbi:oligopeptide transporter [Rhizoctonia solani AG-1 IB]|uniref:Oligopeptide transporter n=1 Tax=Thanatephorus cucumeris (strain AG1-IB / isolate 7/3/14) TaxID=1108050 RepID=M5BY50_THACB|nr:oligopeptide transporter [Rhizoctonia solani AG-1 IB]